MRIISDYELKHASDVQVGELIRHDFHGGSALSIYAAVEDHYHCVVVLDLQRSDRDELAIPFYGEFIRGGSVLSYGSDWSMRLDRAGDFRTGSVPNGAVALTTDGVVLICGDGNKNSFQPRSMLFQINENKRIGQLPNAYAYFSEWSLWVDDYKRVGAEPIFRFTSPPSPR